MFLERFLLPIDIEDTLIAARMYHNGGAYGYIDNIYPCDLFKNKQLQELYFSPITIFYGGNGSGKSTLLNLIAQKMKLKRIAPFNSGELFDSYAEACTFYMGEDEDGFTYRIPNGSRIITSDDIFDYMLAVRSNNDDIRENQEEARNDWGKQKYGETVKFSGMKDYEALRNQVLARRKSSSRRKYIRELVGNEVQLNSNGETALQYFRERLKLDTLYLLDEPENSMSPKMQRELVELLAESARYCGCQLIIATHSPFLLAIEGARIYDLDSSPVTIKDWWDLENTRIYYSFFMEHKELFASTPIRSHSIDSYEKSSVHIYNWEPDYHTMLKNEREHLLGLLVYLKDRKRIEDCDVIMLASLLESDKKIHRFFKWINDKINSNGTVLDFNGADIIRAAVCIDCRRIDLP